MPIIAAKLIPEIDNEKFFVAIDIAAPPKPNTNIEEATITFFIFSKSTLFCINTFKPLTDINPYNSIDTPPSTADGIDDIIAVSSPKNPNIIAIKAASPKTQTEATFVIPTTDVFSPYVVFAGPPIIPAANVARPSPIKVLSSPGSIIKSLSIISPSTLWSPICSAIVTSAIGTIVKMLPKFGE